MKNKWKNIKCEGCALYPLPCIPTLWYFNPGQNGRHFADDIFRCIFVNEKFCILINIILKFVSVGPIDNNPSLVETMVLVQNRRLAFIWTHADPIHWRIYAALGVWMGCEGGVSLPLCLCSSEHGLFNHCQIYGTSNTNLKYDCIIDAETIFRNGACILNIST